MTNLRKPQFARPQSEKLRNTGFNLKLEITSEVERRLGNRSLNANFDDDDEIFMPLVESYTISSIANGEYSTLYREIARQILEDVRKYEKGGMNVNKRRLFFFMALCAVYSNDEINATIYWELTRKEEDRLRQKITTIESIMDPLNATFKSLLNPIIASLSTNSLIIDLAPLLSYDFDLFTSSLTDVPRLSALTCGLRYNKVAGWLNSEYETEMVRRYSEELLAALCILCETIFKNHKPEVTQCMLGPIINQNLRALNSSIQAEMGSIKTQFPTLTEAEFNSHLPQLISSLRTGLGDSKLRATLIHCAYMCRNKVLHESTALRVYYTNAVLFQELIGALFLSAMVIRQLKP